MDVRKTQFVMETVHADGLYEPCDEIRRVAALAVFRNPFAGKFAQDLSPLFDIGGQLGDLLASDACERLGLPAVSYGKAAIVGVDGDMEHGGAAIHPKLGMPMRAATNGGKSVIPSNVKIGCPGCAIDVPLGHKDNAWSFDHFDTMTLMVPDAPRPDEIVIILAFASGGRPIPRCGKGPVTA
jgi:hypothetical protein